MSQGAMHALQAWEACSGSRDKQLEHAQSRRQYRFDTYFYIHTHTSDKYILPVTSTVYLWDIPPVCGLPYAVQQPKTNFTIKYLLSALKLK